MFFQNHITDVVFLILVMTFVERFCLMCSPIEYLGDCHNESRQNKCCSLVIFLVSVYYLYLVVFFPPMFRVFLSRFTGMHDFPSFGILCVACGFLIVFPVIMSKPCSYPTRISDYCVL